MSKAKQGALFVLAGFSMVLTGCGGSGDEPTPDASAPTFAPIKPLTVDSAAAASRFSLADGPDTCFRLVTKKLGPDVKAASLISFFSSGKDIDPGAGARAGAMTTCTVQYQNPQDPRKLLEMSLDVKTGAFSAPSPVEITVMGGDAAKFNLEDHVIALSQVNAAALKGTMDELKPSMDKIYGKHAWTAVRLEAPDAFDSQHTLRLDIEGRLASNDIKEDGYASIATDGKTMRRNLLKP